MCLSFFVVQERYKQPQLVKYLPLQLQDQNLTTPTHFLSAVNLCMLVQHVLWSFLSLAHQAPGGFYSGGKPRLDPSGRSWMGDGKRTGSSSCLLSADASDSRWKEVRGRSASPQWDKTNPVTLLRVMSPVCEIWPGGGRFIILGIWLDPRDVYIHPLTDCAGCRSYLLLD